MKKIEIDSDEAKYLKEVLFIDMLHLQQTNEDTTLPKGLLKKVKQKTKNKYSA